MVFERSETETRSKFFERRRLEGCPWTYSQPYTMSSPARTRLSRPHRSEAAARAAVQLDARPTTASSQPETPATAEPSVAASFPDEPAGPGETLRKPGAPVVVHKVEHPKTAARPYRLNGLGKALAGFSHKHVSFAKPRRLDLTVRTSAVTIRKLFAA